MLATNSAVILVLATVSVATDGTWGPGSGSQELAQARPHDLSVELQQVEHGRFSITTRFRLQGSNVPGELRIELWNGVEHPIAEANFSIRGVSHMHLRQVHGDQEHRVWLSPTMEAELAGDAPQLMPVFWSVLTDPRVHTQVDGWLKTLPPDPLAKNPACGVTKWGLRALVWIAGAACCGGGFGVGCAVCAVGAMTADEALNNGIDCNKECKPDCPIPWAAMTASAPRPPERELARLDRPQRLGFLPTTAFWQRRDVWRMAGPPTCIFVFLWSVMLDLFVDQWTPIWGSGMLGGMGPVLFVGLLEHPRTTLMPARRSEIRIR